MQLSDPLTVLPGIGPKKAEQFATLGIRSVFDLITYFPRTYEDRTTRRSIDQLEPGEPACFEAMVISEPNTANIRKGLDITHVTVADETQKLKLTFFNQRFSAGSLRYGESYLFFGTLDEQYRSMLNPVFEPLDKAGSVTVCILPIYALTAGLSNKTIRKAILTALEVCLPTIPELLPQDLMERYQLCGGAEAYRIIHTPDSMEALQIAKKRLIFEEFFIFSCGLSLMRSVRTRAHCTPMANTNLDSFYQALPFSLTGAQRRAIDEISQDFHRDIPMNRLLQGDVGSGKTMVAAAAIVCAVQNGLQAALMAPTEILAEQHFKSLKPLFDIHGISCCLLTGSMTAKQKRDVKERIALGLCQVVIGTHALFSGDVLYPNLGLVVTDEQHRFGVNQRAALSEKGRNPHLLVMSATPSPRTLALILYGDLDVSVLDEKPAGRQEIDTFLLSEAMHPRANAFVRKQVAEGHQVYIVCPAVEDSETHSMKSVETWAQTLQQTVFPDLRIALLHGQMNSAEKEAVMAKFSAGEFDILVATTVIEVGVDVPNATLMIIEDADRFGLSQLHQLRGRVGRGSSKSYCILFTSQKNPETLQRLKALCGTNDGFKISEEDLALRGPGDFFGSRQSGLPVFRVANLAADLSVLTEAKAAADEYLQRDADFIASPALRERIFSLFQDKITSFN